MRPRPSYLSFLLVLGLVMGLFGVAGAVVINEIRTDQPSTDNDEYFELKGTPGESLNDLTYIVIGDGTGGSGTIEAVVPLTGLSIPAGGYFLAAEGTFSLGPTPDLVTSLNFENSDNVTHMLVSGFTGNNGDDLDTNDDCVLDIRPWTAGVDSVSIVIQNPPVTSECFYAEPVGPDGSFAPGQIYRCGPNGAYVGMWQIGDFDPLNGTDTPRAPNLDCPAIAPPDFVYMTRTPCVPAANTDALITANTTNTISATLYYSVNGGPESSVGMTSGDDITYSGTIPGTAYADGDVVSYYVRIDNGVGDTLDSFGRGFFAGPSAVNIGDLRVNDAQGANIYYGYGVHIQGVTTVPYGLFQTANTEYYVQDSTGGINVFKGGSHTVQPALGNQVEIWGSLSQYGGNLEITNGDCDTLEVEISGPGVLPNPLPVACQDLDESVEGLLIKTRVLLPDSLVGDPFPTGNQSYSMGQSGCESKQLFFDTSAAIPGTFLYRIVDVVGVAIQYFSNYEIAPRYSTDLVFLSEPLGVGDDAGQATFRLMQNIPNPVTSATQIRFQIPAAAGAAGTPVRLDLFDLQGRLVKTLINRDMPEGEYQVNLGPAEIGDLSNGIYFYSLTAGGQKKTMKLMLLH